jgi:hypothetical protein
LVQIERPVRPFRVESRTAVDDVAKNGCSLKDSGVKESSGVSNGSTVGKSNNQQMFSEESEKKIKFLLGRLMELKKTKRANHSSDSNEGQRVQEK